MTGIHPPKFKSLSEEEKFWSTHDSTDYIDYSKVELGFFPELKPSNKIISIRLPEPLIEAVKVLANKRDVPYQSMMKVLLAEKVREELELERGERKVGQRGRKKERLTEKA
ncbi:MAG: BrnA antitoxin family protein, partial [Candidatus Binatota bacterium]